MSSLKNRWIVRLKSMGMNPYVFVSYFRSLPYFFRTRRQAKSLLKDQPEFKWSGRHPILSDLHDNAGTLSGHYFHQDLLVARKIFLSKPVRHIDVGSRTDGFVAHVAVFREIEVLDIRPLESDVENVRFAQADLMNLPPDLIDSCDSISSLHAIEHFGLGRYGDPIDLNGHLKAIDNISRMLKTGGTFYFSVPIGELRIEFNAQRVFSVAYLLKVLDRDFELKEFSFVDDAGKLHYPVVLTEALIQSNCGCHYGCGIFELVKK